MRLTKVATKLNKSTSAIIDFLAAKGFKKLRPNSNLDQVQIELLEKEFKASLLEKEEASTITIGNKNLEKIAVEEKEDEKEVEEQVLIQNADDAFVEEKKEETNISSPKLPGLKVLDKIDLNNKKKKEKITPKKEKKIKEEKKVKEVPIEETVSEKKPIVKETPIVEKEETKEKEKEKETEEQKKTELIKGKAETLGGLKILGKIDLPGKKGKKQPVASSDATNKKKKRTRIKKKKVETDKTENKTGNTNNDNKNKYNKDNRQHKNKKQKQEISQKDIQDSYKATMKKLSKGGNTRKSSIKKVKEKQKAKELSNETSESTVLKVTEFISANDLATLLNVSVNEVISKCLSLGMFVSINQRLDAEAITIIADEFGYQVEFISAEEDVEVELEEQDDAEDLQHRPPIVTVMGHVDHGKTSLLDYIRNTNVIAKEAGGITQHIGAYSVVRDDGRKVTFLDTPGHEAFTAMRARGAKLTDVAIIVVAADDNVMPQTREAINHAQLADVPIVIAISKVDKSTANADKIKEELANENILVEEWGGKYQCQEISSKSGQGIDELLEKVLLEAEILELKANPDKKAVGTVIEASLDKGRGYVTNILIQAGTLEVGDIILAGHHYGRVRAMVDYRGKKLKKAGPSTPIQILGLSGAPQAGDSLHAMETEREAREIANKREQILREQNIRTTKRITLGDIGRRIALGSFQQLNVIVKGDVDGSVEALSDALLKLSTEEIQVNVIHKAVGSITETDINLAAVSDAVVIGFQVRPSIGARRLAEQENVEIRLYSIIYDAINQVKDALEGMLAPKIEEVIVGNLEVRETFRISKIGTIAGCYVLDGYIKRQSKIRVLRDNIVIYGGGEDGGEIGSLKRFKDDVMEVKSGYECGLNIKGFNDLQVGDIIEVFELREVKRTLS